MRGCFITFEGGEGDGESTHARLLANRLNSPASGHTDAQPGGSPGAGFPPYLLSCMPSRSARSPGDSVRRPARDHVRATIRPALRPASG